VLGDILEVVGGRGGFEVGERFVAKGRGDVEFALGAWNEEELDDVGEFFTARGFGYNDGCTAALVFGERRAALVREGLDELA
jgi:hypothetical protein